MRPAWLATVLFLGCARAEPPTGGATAPAVSATAASTATTPTPAAFARDDKAAVQAALASAGVEVGDDPCLSWPSSFPRVVVVGSFANDRGCDVEGIFVDRTWHARGGEVAGLATRGFVDAAMATKQSLARAWADEVVHAFGGGFVTEDDVAFGLDGSPGFTPVSVRANEAGAVVVEGWTLEPAGMVFESTFHHVGLHFAVDGALSFEAGKSFTIDGPRLQQARAAREAAAPR